MRNCFICNSDKNLKILNNINLLCYNEFKLNNNLLIKYCNNCYFYFSDSGKNQIDYNNYYLNFNKYNSFNNQSIDNDKDQKCAKYLIDNLINIDTILDYGSGISIIHTLLKSKFKVDCFDIGMNNNNLYDCILLNHVLEHIFDLNNFINILNKNIKDEGIIYIEVPNAEYYDIMDNICPLQEINIEHINFFTKYSLSKLMINNDFMPLKIEDDYFNLNDKKYYVIRGIFKKKYNNYSFEKYLNNGIKKINNINISNLNNLYIYGSGNFLYNILDKIEKSNNNIINIVDDNINFLGKKINNIETINFEILKNKINDNDNILISSLVHKDIIKKKLKLINKNINIIDINF